MNPNSQPQPRFLAVAPCFFVAAIEPAAAYYRDILGFTSNQIWGEPPCFCMPHRDGLTIMLKEIEDKTRVQPNGGSDGKSWDAYIWVHDADVLFAEFKAKGARVVYEPTDRPFYGNREFAICDLDGYVIAFAHNIDAKARRTP